MMLSFPVAIMVEPVDGLEDLTPTDESDLEWRRSLAGHIMEGHHDSALSSDSKETETDDDPVPHWGRRDDYYSQEAIAEFATRLPVPLPRTASKSRKKRSDATQQKRDRAMARFADIMESPLVPERPCCKSDQCHFASKRPIDVVRLHQERSEFRSMNLPERRRYLRKLLEGITFHYFFSLIFHPRCFLILANNLCTFFIGKTNFLSGRLQFRPLHFIGLDCCGKAACNILGIGYSSLCRHANIISHEDAFAPALHNIRARKAKPNILRNSVVNFLQSMFDSIQQHMPNSLLKTLPSTFTKRSIYEEYLQHRRNIDSRAVAPWKYYLKIWNKHFRDVKAYNYKEGFGRCSLCVSLQTMRENARSEEQQSALYFFLGGTQ
jgi:hypothetical protein